MLRFPKAGVTLLLIVSISACSTNNREQIAMATLFDEPGSNGPLPVLTGALNAKFPPGSEAKQLKKYVAQLHGSCDEKKSDDTLKCLLPESSSICVRNSISVTAKLSGLDKINGIEARRYLDGC